MPPDVKLPLADSLPTTKGASGPITMACLISLVAADEDLTAVRRRNVTSSIRRFCAALGYAPNEAPPDFAFFRDRLTSFHPLAVGIKKKRWQTIRSDVGFALARFGIPKTRRAPQVSLAPAWLQVKDRLSESHVRWRLSRLARYCSARTIQPQQVSDAVMTAYRDEVERQSFKTAPNRHHREVCLNWNKVVDLLPDAGLCKVTMPSYAKTYTFSWEAISVSFRREVDAWLDSMSQEADLLSEDGPIKPLRPASIKTYRYSLRQLVAGLAHSGQSLESIDSLAVLVEPKAAQAALRFYLGRNEGRTSSMIYGLAHILVLVAETAVHPAAEDIEQLKRFRKQLTPGSHGMRPRPRNALRPFTETANIKKILMLPQRIHDRLRRKQQLTLADARLMQVALSLELLLMRPIRRKNLVALKLDEHVIRSGRRVFIVIPSEEVKNDLELDYPIPPESTVLLDFYIEHALPLFGPNPKRWLFPGEREDGSRSPDRFSVYFKKVIKDETGLDLYPHLTRHFGAALYLRENPGAFEVVRHVLGHKSLATTTRSYSNFDDEAAVRMFDSLVLRIREQIRKGMTND